MAVRTFESPEQSAWNAETNQIHVQADIDRAASNNLLATEHSRLMSNGRYTEVRAAVLANGVIPPNKKGYYHFTQAQLEILKARLKKLEQNLPIIAVGSTIATGLGLAALPTSTQASTQGSKLVDNSILLSTPTQQLSGTEKRSGASTSFKAFGKSVEGRK